MIKVLFVDDEPLALEILENYASRLPEVTLIGKASNAIEAQQILEDNEVDLIFLDIQMPQITGLDWLRSLRNPPLTIITTAFPDYALEGYDLNVVDYLLKPIAFDRFFKALNKAKEQIKRLDSNVSSLSESFIYVKADKKLVRVNFNEVVYIEGLKDYVIIRLEGDRIITLQTMKSLEEKLPSNIFRRIHRSYIINIDKIKALDSNGVEVVLKDQVKLLPIGKNYRDEIQAIVDERRI
jgi:DNA-binding LytR/AlgR family response regulator